MSIGIFIADRQPRVRYGMRILLEQQPGWKVRGEAAEAGELLEQMQAACPDLLLLDWELPGMPMEELVIHLRQTYPCLRLVLLSGRLEVGEAALRLSADGFASKTEPPERLISLIQKTIPSKK